MSGGHGALYEMQEIEQEICLAVLERGKLSKQEILETWGLTDEAYREVHRALAGHREIESAGRRIGGLVRKGRRSREDEATPGGEPTFSLESWEEAGARRLEELLDFKTLEALLGTFQYTLRQARLRQSGEDRRGTKGELARALVVQHGLDLFADGAIRDAVGKITRVESPSRWHAGKASAGEFVAAAGFPAEFAGLPASESQPNFEYLEGRFRLEPLQPFQKEVQLGLLETLQEPLGRRCIVTLPTGGGKTRVAVESLAYWLFDRFDRKANRANRGVVLWLAHTEELCEQAASCFRQVWEATDNVCPLTLVRFWGAYTHDLLEHHGPLGSALVGATVLISTPQRIANLTDGKTKGGSGFLERLDESLGLVLIDEAHRAAAPMYQRILGRITSSTSKPSVVGLTATPFRLEYAQDDPEAGTRELTAIFERLVEPTMLGENPCAALQAMQILAEPIFEEIETTTAIRMPGVASTEALSEEDIERIDRLLAVRADNTPRRFQALSRILEIAAEPESSILYFGPSVHDAECMAFLLRQHGVAAAVVSAKTREASRRQVIQRFKRNEIQVLCNCEVLTTGFDAPRVTHVVVARPTVSQVLYEQMVGRGLRGPKFGGTSRCRVVNFLDEYRGQVPQLGYQRFRELWFKGRSTLPIAKRTNLPEKPPRQPGGAFLTSPLPTAVAQSLETAPSEPPADKSAWPELWEEILRWRESKGSAARWEREVLERMATFLRNQWPIDEKTRSEAQRIRLAALKSGFSERSARRTQEQLFEVE